jgi:cell division initiation protein
MKLTPLDIHQKEFRHSLRGYSEEEVDQFLDEVADEFERLFKENIDLSEKLEAAMEKLRGYSEMERTLHNTMLAAQQSAEDIVSKAGKEAELMLRDAEIKAKELVHGALGEKQRTAAEFSRIKQAEDDFRAKFRSLLESYLGNIAEIPVPEEVAALTSGGLEDYQPRAAAYAAPQPVAAPFVPPMPMPVEPEPMVSTPPMPMPVEPMPVEPMAVEPEPVDEAAPVEAEAPVQAEAPAEPGTPSFVSSVQLGETEPPADLTISEPVFPEPMEFTYGQGGERDDDIDIEEID